MGETAAAAALTGTGADMRALADELPGPDGPLPLLILDQRPGMAVRRDPAERADPYFAALERRGLTLVNAASISEPAAPARAGGLSCPRTAPPG